MSVTEPAGFRAAGVAAGIKSNGAPDLALIVNSGPSDAAAGVFTTNKVKAAPVLWTQQVARGHGMRAVVLNSGGANACTGPEGFQDTHATAEKVAEVLQIGASEVGVCSTGLIGERLPINAVLSGVDLAATELERTEKAGTHAAQAVLTTDSQPKQARAVHANGWTIGGLAKGAGMLAPNLATMLSVVTTDAVIASEELDSALRAATRVTFDRLDVDGGTSTNDTVLLLASGSSGIEVSTTEFTTMLTSVCSDLVGQLRADAEGATKEIDVVVRGAATEEDAVRIGRVIAEDNLVKTALFGSDPNWGRVAMALGRVDADIDVSTVEIAINGIVLYSRGTKAREREAVDLSGKEIEVLVDLHRGEAGATILTTDLSHDYVEENSAYSS